MRTKPETTEATIAVFGMLGEVLAGIVNGVYQMGVADATAQLAPSADLEPFRGMTLKLFWEATDKLEEARNILRAV